MLSRIVPLIAGAHVLVAASSGPPKVDIQATCRISANEVMKLFGDTTPAAHLDSCMRSQNDALNELENNWATYPAEDKQQCAQPNSYMPSYVEWITCFEMARDVRRFRAENPKAVAPPTRKRKGQ